MPDSALLDGVRSQLRVRYPAAAPPAVQKSQATRVLARVLKFDAELGILTGVIMEPEVPDTKDGDVASAEEIYLACVKFAARYRERTSVLGLQHQAALEDEDAVMVENYCTPCEVQLGEQTMPAGTWIQSWQLRDAALREAAKNGTLTGFSIGATLYREPLEAAS